MMPQFVEYRLKPLSHCVESTINMVMNYQVSPALKIYSDSIVCDLSSAGNGHLLR